MSGDNRATFYLDLSAPDTAQKLHAIADAMEGVAREGSGAEESLKHLEGAAQAGAWSGMIHAARELAEDLKGILEWADGVSEHVAHAQKQTLKWANALDLTADKMEALARVGSFGGLGDVGAMSQALMDLSRKAFSAELGMGRFSFIFKALHLSAKDANGQLKQAPVIFEEVMNRLAGLHNKGQAQLLANYMMGAPGMELLGTLQLKGTDMTGFLRDMQSFNVLSGEQRKALAELAMANHHLELQQQQLDQLLAGAVAGPLLAFKELLYETTATALRSHPGWVVLFQGARALASPVASATAHLVEFLGFLRLLAPSLFAAGGLLANFGGWLTGLAGPLGVVVIGVAAFAAQLLYLKSTTDQARQGAEDYNAVLREMAAEGRITQHQLNELSMDMAKAPTMWTYFWAAAGGGKSQRYIDEWNDRLGQAPGPIGKASHAAPTAEGVRKKLEGLKAQKVEQDELDQAVQLASQDPTMASFIALRNAGKDAKAGEREAKEAAKAAHDAEKARLQAAVDAAKLAEQRAQARHKATSGRAVGTLPDHYADGQQVGGYTIAGVLSHARIHHGTHGEPGTFDIGGRQLELVRKRTGKSWAEQQQELAALGLVVAWRKRGDPKITNDHFHVADPRLSPVEAARIRGQRRVVAGPSGGGGALPETLARQRAELALARFEGPHELARTQFEHEQEAAKREEAEDRDKVAMLQAAIKALKAGGPALMQDLVGRHWVTDAPDTDGLLREANVSLRRVKARVSKRGGEAAAFEGAAEEAQDEQAQQRAALEQEQSQAEATRDLLQTQLDVMREQRASTAEQLAQLNAVEAVERRLLELHRQQENLGGSPAVADTRFQAASAALDARLQRERRELAVAGLEEPVRREATLAQLADTPGASQRHLRLELDALQREADGIAALEGQSQRYLDVLLKIKAVKQELFGKLSTGQEVLRSSAGGAADLNNWLTRERLGTLTQLTTAAVPDLRTLKSSSRRIDDTRAVTEAAGDGALKGLRDGAPLLGRAIRQNIAAGFEELAAGLGVG